MKKMIVLVAVLVMAMSASAWAEDAAVKPAAKSKQEQARELIMQGIQLNMQAADLFKQAAKLEAEIVKKPGEKMRDYGYIEAPDYKPFVLKGWQ